MSEWQPIETAPLNEFLLLYEDGAMRCGMWSILEGRWEPAEIPILIDKVGNRLVSREVEEFRGERLELSGFLWEPTHWMPLPPPPRDTDGSWDGQDPEGLDGEAATAGAEGIAQTTPPKEPTP
jgi:hypothetical protein